MNALNLNPIYEMEHSPYGASSLSRYSKCPGSINLSKGIPSTTSVYAKEGTLAHEMIELILTDKKSLSELEGLQIYDAVKLYINYIHAILNINTDSYIEYKFDLSQIFDGMFGTSDAVIYNRASKKLHVIDYKHGAGVAVEAKDNLQLQFYALGSLLNLNLPCEEVEMTIVQPRCKHDAGPIRSWSVPSIHFIDFAADLKMYAVATQDPNAPLIGGDHCMFCPASKICPSFVKPKKIIKNVDPRKQFTVVTDEN
jgi:hypothetical protein